MEAETESKQTEYASLIQAECVIASLKREVAALRQQMASQGDVDHKKGAPSPQVQTMLDAKDREIRNLKSMLGASSGASMENALRRRVHELEKLFVESGGHAGGAASPGRGCSKCVAQLPMATKCQDLLGEVLQMLRGWTEASGDQPDGTCMEAIKKCEKASMTASTIIESLKGSNGHQVVPNQGGSKTRRSSAEGMFVKQGSYGRSQDVQMGVSDLSSQPFSSIELNLSGTVMSTTYEALRLYSSSRLPEVCGVGARHCSSSGAKSYMPTRDSHGRPLLLYDARVFRVLLDHLHERLVFADDEMEIESCCRRMNQLQTSGSVLYWNKMVLHLHLPQTLLLDAESFQLAEQMKRGHPLSSAPVLHDESDMLAGRSSSTSSHPESLGNLYSLMSLYK